jgi:hypothetical protein
VAPPPHDLPRRDTLRRGTQGDGRFAWLGAGIVLLAVGGLATVGTQDTWLDGYGIIAYGLVPLAFIPLAAGFIASARASRFVESVFTAPIRRGDWLAAKILVLLTMAAPAPHASGDTTSRRTRWRCGGSSGS